MEELLERFLQAAAGIAGAKRDEISRRLSKAGFAWVDHAASELEVGAELNEKFGLAADQQPKLRRVAELAAHLTDLCAKLDQTTFNTWNSLSKSNPASRRHQDFRALVARHLSGEGEGLERHLQAISALVGGLQVALLKGGKEFEHYYIDRFAPEAIAEVVEGEGGGGLFKNKKERCWDKYREQAKDFAAPGVIEKLLNDSFVKLVENCVRSNR
ncbi:MAG TPA: type VI secretion system-associated FHA domain protein [Candidatus Acidoferrum sp.]|nr:type VI secretion system-associated FHA domain protein [Candidatus Acidoferrum sp.]